MKMTLQESRDCTMQHLVKRAREVELIMQQIQLDYNDADSFGEAINLVQSLLGALAMSDNILDGIVGTGGAN